MPRLGGGAIRPAISNMTIRYLHVRAIDEEGVLLPHGGVTVAYTITDIANFSYIYLQIVKCRPTELFCYKTGRERAKELLEKEGPFEVLELEHPISNAIVDWIANCLWPQGSIALAYRGDDMGYSIDIDNDEKGRWISTFEPSQIQIEFTPEKELNAA